MSTEPPCKNQTSVTTQEKLNRGSRVYRKSSLVTFRTGVSKPGLRRTSLWVPREILEYTKILKFWNTAIYSKHLPKCFEFSLQINFLDYNLAVTERRSQVSAFSALETSSPQGVPRDTKNYFQSSSALDRSLHSAHTVPAGVLYVSQNEQQLLLRKTLTAAWVFNTNESPLRGMNRIFKYSSGKP
jgi:hypothetical protein